MYKNYIRIALRNFLKNPYHLGINIVGLGLALACCIITYLLFEYNINFDSTHKNVSNVYRINSHMISESSTEELGSTPPPVGPLAKQEIAGIEDASRYTFEFAIVNRSGTVFQEMITYTDLNFFQFFDFPFLHGKPENFKGVNSMVVTESFAKKYFGDSLALGGEVFVQYNEEDIKGFTIVGIVKDNPANSSFTFNAIVPFEHYMKSHRPKDPEWAVTYLAPSTFVKLKSAALIPEAEKQLQKYVAVNNELNPGRKLSAFSLVPFKELGSQVNVGDARTRAGIPSEPLILFMTLAAFILLIACFNFTNTSISLARKRLKEIGVRKVLGSRKGQIIKQFMIENFAICFLAVLAGLAFAEVLVPQFNLLWGSNFQLTYSNNLLLFGFLFSLVILTGMIAGFYPSVYLSSFQPSRILKGITVEKGPGTVTKVLLTFQFSLSLIGIVAGVVFYKNSVYQNNVDLGYNKDNVVFVYVTPEQRTQVFKEKILQHTTVESAGGSSQHIGFSGYDAPAKYKEIETTAAFLGVGKDYIKTMGLQITQGRDFYYQTSDENMQAVIINEKMAQALNLTDPVGTFITIENQIKEVIGVVKNFYPYGVFSPVLPMAFGVRMDDNISHLAIRVKEGTMDEFLPFLEKTWKEVFPSRPFSSNLQDTVLDGARRLNSNMVKIFLFLAILSSVLSVAGLYSLVSLTINKRVKEIGIRKVMGASVHQLMYLINTDFMIILGIASVIGCVAGYFLIGTLLDTFYKGQRIELGVWIFASSFLVLLMICLLTIGGRVYSAAAANPAGSLRSE